MQKLVSVLVFLFIASPVFAEQVVVQQTVDPYQLQQQLQQTQLMLQQTQQQLQQLQAQQAQQQYAQPVQYQTVYQPVQYQPTVAQNQLEDMGNGVYVVKTSRGTSYGYREMTQPQQNKPTFNDYVNGANNLIYTLNSVRQTMRGY